MVTYTFTNGTVADADEVNQNFTDVQTKRYVDNVGGSNSSSTETDLANITIVQNDLSSNSDLFISASLLSSSNESLTSSTYKLYVGGVEVDSQVHNTSSINTIIQFGGSFSYLAIGQDSTVGDIEVKVTGTQSGLGSCNCKGLVVIGYNN